MKNGIYNILMIDYKKLKSGIYVKEGAHRSWRPPVSTFLNRGATLLQCNQYSTSIRLFLIHLFQVDSRIYQNILPLK